MNADDLIRKLEALGDPEKARQSARFFKTGPGQYGEGDRFLGISVPDQRKVARAFKELSLSEIETLLKNEFHEIRLTTLFLMVLKIKKGNEAVLEQIAQLYLRNLRFINNWDLVDSSAHLILGPYLQNRDRSILYELSRSKDLWERRIAMISCYHYIRENDFEDALKIAEILVEDEHDLIQKATGWMLREIGNRDLPAEEAFLKKHYQTMPRTMLRYAIEKFEEPLRLRYLQGQIGSES